MTIAEIVDVLGRYPWHVLAVFLAIPAMALAYGAVHRKGGGGVSPHRYVYAVLVYAACVPGMFASVLTGYSLFFLGSNLLQANLLVYFVPTASMVATLVLIRKNVDLNAVPGFDRLVGLCILLAITFAVALAVTKTRIWIIFGSSFATLIVLSAFVFALLKWASYTLFRSSGEPKRGSPKLPDIPGT